MRRSAGLRALLGNRPMFKARSYAYTFRTRFGSFCLSATSKGLYSLDIIAKRHTRDGGKQSQAPSRIYSLLRKTALQLQAYLAGEKVNFGRLPVDWTGLGPFGEGVLRELRKIPSGKTQSYQFLAQKAGKPQAARAVGQILHRNRLPLIVPCHRIVPQGGGLGGFSSGIQWKKRLLKLERGRADTQG